jgi:hypothetical protein
MDMSHTPLSIAKERASILCTYNSTGLGDRQIDFIAEMLSAQKARCSAVAGDLAF